MSFENIRESVACYYTETLREHGPSPRGVDWNSLVSQQIRFEQLLKVVEVGNDRVSIIDYGCGYGALLDFIVLKGYSFNYCGFDLSSQMIAVANDLHPQSSDVQFVVDESYLPTSDYTIASGIFNVRLDKTDSEWLEYILFTLHEMDKLSTKGFSFNVLTSYSDAERMRSKLYYANPCFLFDYCKNTFSRRVALLHDYELYEFTILVRK